MCRAKIDVSNLDREAIHKLNEDAEHGLIRDQRTAGRWISKLYKKPGADSGIIADAENKGTDGSDAVVLGGASYGAADGGRPTGRSGRYIEEDWIKVPDADDTVCARYIRISTDDNNLDEDSSTVLGWTENGEFYSKTNKRSRLG